MNAVADIKTHEVQAEIGIVALESTPSMAGLYSALAKARGEFPEIEKTRTATIKMKAGGQYSYKYADLADVFKAVNPALAAYDLCVMQYPSADGRDIITEVGHGSGASKVTPWPIKPMPQRGLDDAQSFQSAVQVAKRYSLTAAIGVSTEETIEGDPRAHKKSVNQKSPDPYIEDDGIRLPVGAKWDKDMNPREVAQEAARAIEAQMDDVKTAAGLNGVWNRNQRFIDSMNEKHDDLFQSIFDKFHKLLEELESA